jgi:hypothetical protein
VSWSQSVEAHQEIFTFDTTTASGRYPVNKIDPMGLCEDVDRMKKFFDEVIQEWIDAGMRLEGTPNLNNWISQWQKVFGADNPLMQCVDQAAAMRMQMSVFNSQLDANWTFYEIWSASGSETGGNHGWVVGVSDNSSDPYVVIDPWYKKFDSVQRGGGSE